MKQRVYLTSDNKLVVETDNCRLQNGETETVVKGEFTISAHDVNTLRVVLNEEILTIFKGYPFGQEAWGYTGIIYGRDEGIEALKDNIETLKAENEELKQQTALQRESLALKAQCLKGLSLWDRIFKWKKQFD